MGDENPYEKAIFALGLMAMMAELRGKVLHRVVKQGRAQLVSDYSGGSALAQVSQTLHLQSGLRFRFEEKTFTAITGGGLSLPSEKVRRASGEWRLNLNGDELFLELDSQGAPFARWTFEQPSPDVVMLDGAAWRCTSER